MPDKLHRLKEILIRENRSQYWLANQTGMSYNSVSGYVNYKIEPSLRALFRIADALNRCDRPNSFQQENPLINKI